MATKTTSNRPISCSEQKMKRNIYILICNRKVIYNTNKVRQSLLTSKISEQNITLFHQSDFKEKYCFLCLTGSQL